MADNDSSENGNQAVNPIKEAVAVPSFGVGEQLHLLAGVPVIKEVKSHGLIIGVGERLNDLDVVGAAVCLDDEASTTAS